MQKTALFSLDNLKNVSIYASDLISMGWNILATSETVNELKKHKIEVEEISTFVNIQENFGFPPTLHPKIEAALTKDTEYRIDLIYDVPYGIEKGIDVGGRTLLALGAKGNRIVASEHEDMERIIFELKNSPDHFSISIELRQMLIDKVYACIANYYLDMARRRGISNYDGIMGTSSLELLNGENPYQVPANLFIENLSDQLGFGNLISHSRKKPCFTNLADIDSVLQTLCLANEAFKTNMKKIPYIAIAAKHGNPCGMAIDWHEPSNAAKNALWGNPRAIWGGEFIANFKISQDIAEILYKSEMRKNLFGNPFWMLDVIVAPEFESVSIDLLSKREERKIFSNFNLYNSFLPPNFTWHYRKVRGGFLRQPINDYIPNFECIHWTKKDFKQDLDSLILSWSTVWTSNHGGNEAAIAKEGKLLGVGGGPSTLDAVKTAILRAKYCGHDTINSVFALDAFFPYPDAPQLLKEAGCIGGIVPTGSKNDDIILKYFFENNIWMGYIPKEFRGFCRH